MPTYFIWDPVKAHRNLIKHGISFSEAVSIFSDPFHLSLFDPDHSEQEDRWVSLGLSEFDRVILLVHTDKEEFKDKETIRLISARKANREEQTQYWSRRPI